MSVDRLCLEIIIIKLTLTQFMTKSCIGLTPLENRDIFKLVKLMTVSNGLGTNWEAISNFLRYKC